MPEKNNSAVDWGGRQITNQHKHFIPHFTKRAQGTVVRHIQLLLHCNCSGSTELTRLLRHQQRKSNPCSSPSGSDAYGAHPVPYAGMQSRRTHKERRQTTCMQVVAITDVARQAMAHTQKHHLFVRAGKGEQPHAAQCKILRDDYPTSANVAALTNPKPTHLPEYPQMECSQREPATARLQYAAACFNSRASPQAQYKWHM